MEQNTYTLFWLTGQAEIVKGSTIATAMKHYSAGALRALDFYSNGDKTCDYKWDVKSRSWIPVEKRGTQRSPFGIGS